MRLFPVISIALALAACGSEMSEQCKQAVTAKNGVNLCSAKRAVVRCHSGDVTEQCLSDAVDACPPGTMTVGNCSNYCTDTEFGLTCTSAEDAPKNCRSAGVTSISEFYCCPCQ